MEKLGVVCNILARRLAAGDRFEDLALRFAKEGFTDIEIRDGDYLRKSAFGVFLDEIDKTAAAYPAAAWKGVCEALSSGANPGEAIRPADRALFDGIRRFTEKTAGITLTYALMHPWLSRPADQRQDDLRIIAAKKLAFLLSPRSARMRLVDSASPEPFDDSAAGANLRRYCTLAGGLPVIHAVENSRRPASLFLKIAAAADFSLAYDEANLFLPVDRIVEEPERFWESLDPRFLASIHLKQKSFKDSSPLPCLGPGRVDIHGIMRHVRRISYIGDILLENAPSDDPLQDAKKSRDYVFGGVEA
jgi:hypothetical protein